MFIIAYAFKLEAIYTVNFCSSFKGQVHVFARGVKIVSHSPCRTSAILKHFCPLLGLHCSRMCPVPKSRLSLYNGIGLSLYKIIYICDPLNILGWF